MKKIKILFLGFLLGAMTCFIVSYIIFESVIKTKTDATLLVGGFEYNNGNYIEALRAISVSVYLDDNRYSSHIMLGNIYKQLGDTENALKEYNKALKLISAIKDKTLAIHEETVLKNLMNNLK